MRNNIHCLMTSSVSLTSHTSDILFDIACEMIKSGSQRKRFVNQCFGGIITTSFQAKSLSGISGIEFFAEIETELGKGKVKFLVREADAEIRNKLNWVPMFFVEDIPVGLDASPSRQTPMYN